MVTGMKLFYLRHLVVQIVEILFVQSAMCVMQLSAEMLRRLM